MQVKYINPFTKATVNLFKNFLEVNIEPGKPHLKEDPYDLEEVSGIIGLAGETAGAVVMSFSRETAIAAVSRMEKTTYQALSRAVIDGVGELVNIIAGNAKKDLVDFRIDISLPGVVTGNSYQIHWPEGIPVVAVPFTTDVGPLTVNVSLRDLA
jgi:chemotaxis protein CheX